MRFLSIVAAFILAASFSTPLIAFAVDAGTTGSGIWMIDAGSTGAPVVNSGQNVTLINPLKSGTSLESFLGNILDFIIRIGTIVGILMLVFVGYKFVVAQ